jgi:hypothetical protein
VLLSAVTIALLVLPAPAGANPIPDAMVYFNVRPAGPPEDRCVTDITSCWDMHASTPAQGLVEFQIFVNPQRGIHDGIPVWDFWTYLTWPEAWTLVDTCFNADDGALYFQGPGAGYLGCGWDCWVPDSMFLAATLVFDVQGHGRLDTHGDCELGLDCPSHYVVYPTAHFGEAGTGCEYTEFACATNSYHCVPILTGLQVQLTAPEGGTAHDELPFTIDGYPYPICEFTVNSEAPWATGYVVSEEYSPGVLYVDADASGLEPGVHESEMQLVYDQVGGWGTLARCLPVILTVEPASSVEGPVAANPPAPPLGLRLTGASPSAGPFVFAYENSAAAPVRCGVFDAAGREVVPLLDGEQPGGHHTITWRATDAEGRRVRPGIYLVRLAVDGQVRSSRVVVVR